MPACVCNPWLKVIFIVVRNVISDSGSSLRRNSNPPLLSPRTQAMCK